MAPAFPSPIASAPMPKDTAGRQAASTTMAAITAPVPLEGGFSAPTTPVLPPSAPGVSGPVGPSVVSPVGMACAPASGKASARAPGVKFVSGRGPELGTQGADIFLIEGHTPKGNKTGAISVRVDSHTERVSRDTM